MGVGFVVTFFIAIVGVIQRNHVTIGLVITNYVLLADAIGVLVIGSFVWFFTLRERANFHTLWLAATPQDRQQLQDQVDIINPCHLEVSHSLLSSNVVDILLETIRLRLATFVSTRIPSTSSTRPCSAISV